MQPELNAQLMALAEAAHAQLGAEPLTRAALTELQVGVMAAELVGGLLESMSARGHVLDKGALIACEQLTRSVLAVGPTLHGIGSALDDLSTRQLERAAVDASRRLHTGLLAAYENVGGKAVGGAR